MEKLHQKYDDEIIEQIANAIYNYHKDKSTMYKLDTEAKVVYEEKLEKYNDQFNLKWSGMLKIKIILLIIILCSNNINVLLHILATTMSITQDLKKT